MTPEVSLLTRYCPAPDTAGIQWKFKFEVLVVCVCGIGLYLRSSDLTY